jgi:hypothetical protein
MAEALVDVALATTIATADADNSRQQTTINNTIGLLRGFQKSSGGTGIVIPVKKVPQEQKTQES